MKVKKPYFWDLKKPNIFSYILLPFTILISINNILTSLIKKNKVNKDIKTICVGNIYIGGTGKTPLVIKLSDLLKKLNYKTGVVKKFYKDQNDEQQLIRNKTKLYCFKKRKNALNRAIKDKIDVAIFDDGLQDRSINYNLKFVCFNRSKSIGNGFLIPAGPLREKIKSLKKYDAVFINGNKKKSENLKSLCRKYNSKIKIFETYYRPTNIKSLNKRHTYLIFSGIGNPSSFRETVIENNLNIIKEIIFPDHYQYNKRDIKKIKSYAKNSGSKILTTEKDYSKLDKNDVKGINYLSIDLFIKNENKFIKFINSKI
tara:strand:+ start:1172 stop:2113 length:942 start_codon:yes stop_codon:yes gene_type:complete